MEKSSQTYIAALVIVGLVIGVGIGYYVAPPKIETKTITDILKVNPLEGKEIILGDIVFQTARFEEDNPLIKNIIIPDLNEYCAKLGYDITFDAYLDDAKGETAIALEKAQSFHTMGIDIIIGSISSAQSMAILPYANENNMLVFAAGATSPMLSIEGDNFYRLCPSDITMAPAAAEMMHSFGIEAVLVIQRADAWADGVYNFFAPAFENLGGVIVNRIRYATEVQEFSTYLIEMNEDIQNANEKYGKGHVAILELMFSERLTMYTQAEDYPEILDVLWFGMEAAGRDQRTIDQAPEVAVKIRVFSPLMTCSKTSKYVDFDERFTALVGYPAGLEPANAYDSIFITAYAMMETGSTDPEDVIRVLSDVSNSFFGTSGWTSLDKYGDRNAGIFDIWGYCRLPDGSVGFTRYGTYDGLINKVTWDMEELAKEGLTLQGPG